MGKITIAQAAERLGTSQAMIHSWIEQGLLKAHYAMPALPQARRTGEELHGTFSLSYLGQELYVDESELYEVAETEGWLMLTAETWDRDGDDG